MALESIEEWAVVTFSLHPQLAADTRLVASLTLSDVRLMDDSRYLWCILVPRLPDLRDLHDVPHVHKAQLLREIDQVSIALAELAQACKMNVAALGNMVEQLHIHVIARLRNDAAWPGPVWGVGNAKPYDGDAAEAVLARLRVALNS